MNRFYIFMCILQNMYIFMINLLPFVENRQINISLALTHVKGLSLWYLERMLMFSAVFIIKG